jgi:hypothetical protein
MFMVCLLPRNCYDIIQAKMAILARTSLWWQKCDHIQDSSESLLLGSDSHKFTGHFEMSYLYQSTKSF